MGVPKLFKIILDRFSKSHAKVRDQPIDYFFIDFNGLIYESWEVVRKKLINSNGSANTDKDGVEDMIIKQVIEQARSMIVDYVKPKKMVYFAFDGPPPRGKMVQQRDRRYKRLLESEIISSIKQKWRHKDSSSSGEIWSTSYITPGTEFMMKMSLRMQDAIGGGMVFPTGLQYVLSDAQVAGEGEHKFMRFLDLLGASRICIYSNDGDVIMLANRFPQHQVYILTRPKETSMVVEKYYSKEKYMYIVIAGLDDGFAEQFNAIRKYNINLRRLKFDYLFFTMLGGNDFVIHLYFLRMKDEHTFKVLKSTYQTLYPKHGYLISVENNKNNSVGSSGNNKIIVNQRFLYEFLLILGSQEKRWLIEKGDRMKEGKPARRDDELVNQLEPWEREWISYQHTDFWRRNHPNYSKVAGEFRKIDYRAGDTAVWKKQYYQEFFGVNYSDRKKVDLICQEYLKSWFYCLYYYLDKVPSWRWYYPYHASPLPSDIAVTLKGIKDINLFCKFSGSGGSEGSGPYKPLEQLMLVLPKKAAKDGGFLGSKFINIMNKYPQYYPDKFKLDILWGQKYIYSEPILPNIDDKTIIREINKIKLTEEEKLLNTLHEHPLVYNPKL